MLPQCTFCRILNLKLESSVAVDYASCGIIFYEQKAYLHCVGGWVVFFIACCKPATMQMLNLAFQPDRKSVV